MTEMTDKITRSVVSAFGAIMLSMTLGAPAAFAGGAKCPCLTSDQVDGWVQARVPDGADGLKDPAGGKLIACVDDPGYTTFDYFGRPGKISLLLDVTYGTSYRGARCVVDTANSGDGSDLKQSQYDITDAEAESCRSEILHSVAWNNSSCPNN